MLGIGDGQGSVWFVIGFIGALALASLQLLIVRGRWTSRWWGLVVSDHKAAEIAMFAAYLLVAMLCLIALVSSL